MSHHSLSVFDHDWPLPPLPPSRRESAFSTSTCSSGSASAILGSPSSPFCHTPISPATSPGTRSRVPSLHDDVTRLQLSPAVTMMPQAPCAVWSWGRDRAEFAFYPYLQEANLMQTVHGTKLPVPHLEHPKLRDEPSLRISFLEEQTVQSASTVFTTQLSYTFEDWRDCVQFQELILAAKLVFIAGIAEAKSKGRGEECISQNLRIFRGYNGKQVMLFFANSQRKELKRYVSIPVNCIETVNPGKKAGRPVVLELHPNFDILSQMKSLHIQFLDDQDTLWSPERIFWYPTPRSHELAAQARAQAQAQARGVRITKYR
ncbi:uncharacterized protein P174DRAFT_432230 [Aspergillus novofumigatus IBT 16806]|uniref:Uncharacterized protein n=1 Tax=Aspergillus novofumigatus (strain IBT 16806) TaxID=1392255 RepID=A0A2I1C5D4_ASPN1|nr:uncharacterized protein P174DRAFT_432230 [Aspergillus novofumigatus IBT 16806]PKX92868.1 hypothetical protein P174DRAFT_432230 [Aspergillus novofumigatus IBT 16806]